MLTDLNCCTHGRATICNEYAKQTDAYRLRQRQQAGDRRTQWTAAQTHLQRPETAEATMSLAAFSLVNTIRILPLVFSRLVVFAVYH